VAALADRAEQRAGGDPCRVAPSFQRGNWTGDRAPYYADRGPLAFLIGLAVPDRELGLSVPDWSDCPAENLADLDMRPPASASRLDPAFV
jgi:hypothetical protein